MLMQRWTPGSGLRSELGRVAEHLLRNPWSYDPWSAWTGDDTVGLDQTSPHAQLLEKEDGLLVRVELPGIDPKDVDLSLTGDVLTLSVEQEEQADPEQEEGGTSRFRSLRRTIQLPYAVDPDKVTARSHHGVLQVFLGKPADAMPRRIAVSTD